MSLVGEGEMIQSIAMRFILLNVTVFASFLLNSVPLCEYINIFVFVVMIYRLIWQISISPHFVNAQAGFRKGRGTRDQIVKIHWIIEKAREFQKNIYFCFIDYNKAFDCVNQNKLWKILNEMGIPDHLTCLLRNLYAA